MTDKHKEQSQTAVSWVMGRLATKIADAAIVGIIGLIGLILSGLWQPFAERTVAIWNSPLVLTEIQSTLDNLTGANRITDQPKDMSYVEEPVYVGEPIVLILFIGRTELGTSCILKSIVPLFTDESNVPYPTAKKDPRQQLGPRVVKRRVVLDPPAELMPGRTSIRLQLEYSCGGEPFFENTLPVYYHTLEKPV